jgi:stress response protein YsnF
MTETPVEESVRLREERANVQRRAVDRPATEADLAAFKEGSIEVREMSEEAVVSKSARVVGEVEIGKTATEREETVPDTVRKTKIDMEKIEGNEERRDRLTREPALSDAGSSQVAGSTHPSD